MKCKRVLLKLSGESLSGESQNGISNNGLQYICDEIKSINKEIQLAIVVGAGNIWRVAGNQIDRVTADYMGMLATVMNALALCDCFKKSGMKAHVQSAIDVSKLAEFYIRDKAIEYLEQNRIVVFAGGTTNPFFTTDTTAALRASEINADIVLKATQVDGIYDADPKIYPNAKKFLSLTYEEAIEKSLKIMDSSAFSLCKDNALPIIVFDFYKKGNLKKVLSGEYQIGTIVTSIKK